MSTVWTLLITDDCQEDREVYREYLSSDPEQSYQFVEAGSAEAGLALCQRQQCDAILLDFCLPDMTGLEFLDHLKQQSGTLLPVIMLTGQGDERVAVQAMKQGVQDYLVKQDLAPDILQLTVRNVIQQAHLRSRSNPMQERQLSAEIALRLHRSLNLEQILQTAVTEVQKLLACDRVVIYQISQNPEDQDAPVPSLTPCCETSISPDSSDPIPTFLSFLTDIARNDPWSGLAEQTANRQDRDEASILVAGKRTQKTYLLAPVRLPLSPSDQLEGPETPLLTSRIWGLLVAESSNQRQWTSDEASFLKELASQLAIALHQSEQLTRAIAALEAEKQLNAVKSHWVATVSQDYRAPLAAILAAASTLKLHGDQLHESKQQQFLHLIEAKARQMTQLVDDLLVLETLEAGKANFVPLPFELLQFISDVIEEQRQLVGDRCQLIFKITGNTKGFWGDQPLFRLILVNLLATAIHASTDGGVIDVHLTGNDTHIVLEVKDEDMGQSDGEWPQGLSSLSHGSHDDPISGMGLGLAIVKACVDIHDGEVSWAHSDGNSTQFTVRLPKRSTAVLSFN